MTDSNSMELLIARHLAERSRPQTLRAVVADMGLENLHRSTIWRWLKAAQDAGLVQMHGDKKSSTWTASEEMRRTVLREQLDAPLSKRPLISYQESFLEEYEPNKTFYLSPADRERMHRQSEVGSAKFTALSSRDQSLFLCGLSHASSAMEGNRYDFISTEKLLVDGLTKEDATPEETTMVINHHEAVKYLVENISYPSQQNDVIASVRDIKSLHGLLSTNLLRNPAMCGAVRHAPVKINQSAYIPLALHDAIEHALAMICDKAQQIEDPFEQAFFLLVHLPYLQPFEDCNKRTSRVACNIPLLRSGVVPMSWMDVNPSDYSTGLIGVYERNNTTLLSEVFVDGYMHSTERFEIMRRAASPDTVQVRYRSVIKQIVRAVVLDGDCTLPSDVTPQDIPRLRFYVEQELDLLREGNIGALVRHGLREGDVQAWAGESSEEDRASTLSERA